LLQAGGEIRYVIERIPRNRAVLAPIATSFNPAYKVALMPAPPHFCAMTLQNNEIIKRGEVIQQFVV
jgi:hypothetical protein